MKLDVSSDPAGRAAETIAAAIRSGSGPFHLALSGGRTPWAMCRALATMDIAWERVHVWQVDERFAPPGHPDRNWTQLEASLDVPATFHPMPVDTPAPVYPIPPLDIVQLGLGTDGHTASLFGSEDPPGLIAVTGPYQEWRRLTLTFAPIRAAREVLWLVTGAEKREVLARLLAGDTSIPAGRVGRMDATIFCDQAALPMGTAP